MGGSTALITSLDHPAPRTNNHGERANRRYGWGSKAGRRATFIALQGFDTS